MILFNGGTGFGMKKGSNQLLTLIAAFFYLSDCEISDILLFHILLSILDIDAAFRLLTQLIYIQSRNSFIDHFDVHWGYHA